MTWMKTALTALTCTLAGAAVARAQTPAPSPVSVPAEAPASSPHAFEGAVGLVRFLDDSVARHSLLGGAWRYRIWRGVSIGSEVQFMRGPGDDRDLLLTGNVTLDLLAPTAAKPRRTTPFVVVGVGLSRYANKFSGDTYASTEGAVTAGVGLRTWVSPRLFVAGDARVGWEPHLRLALSLGVTLR